MALRPELRRVVDDLLAHRRSLTLDEVAEAIGDVAISSDEIDELLSEVEASAEVESAPALAARESLARVLASARTLKGELGRAPSPEEIAKHAGLSRDSVRLALLYARTLSR